ncbi:MAG TPA: RsmE family RNA methyltransferase [Ktedonobacterales bacterium]|nr:RsmE family RNA methyltransferase [Ktedonobacterales bacterium]
MPAGRFVLTEVALAEGAEIVLPLEIAHQARDVLRLAPGDRLWLLDGVGGEYPAELVVVERGRVTARLGARQEGRAEPAARVVLCQGVLKAAKLELVLQKCTELGVAAFVPLLTERAVAAAEEASKAKRRRWVKIVTEAVEQCGGTRLPQLSAPRPLVRALAEVPLGAVALIPWEEERATPLRAALHEAVALAGGMPSEVWLFVGPEGGFAAGEVALARRHGAIAVTLGPRILRAETAAIVAATLALEALAAMTALA